MHKKTSFLIKLLLFLILVILVYFIWNAAQNVDLNTISQTEALKQMNSLQEKYSITVAYSTNQGKMNDYLTELSSLSGKTTGSAQKIIEAELSSALTFYHLTKTISLFQTIDYTNEKCASQLIVEVRKQLKLAEDNSLLAEEKINALNEQEKQSLRLNLLETIQTYQETIAQLTSYFEEKC